MAAIVNDRDEALQAVSPRLVATSVAISSTGASFTKLKNGGAVTPSSLVLTANTTVFSAPVTYEWLYATDAAPETYTSITSGTSNTYTLTSATYNTHRGSGLFVRYKVIATKSGYLTASNTFDITYTAEADEPLIVSQSRATVTVPASSTGVVTDTSNTSTVISVKRGSIDLTYAASGANTFSIASVPTVSGVTSPTISSATVGDISGMSAAVGTRTMVVTVRDASGNAISPDYTLVQNFTRVNAGSAGAAGSGVSIHLTRTAVTVPSNTDGSSPVLTGTGTAISVEYNGSALTYSDTIVASSFKVVATPTGVTPGTASGTGTTRTYADLTAFSSEPGYITFTITVRDASSVETTYTRIQTFSKAKAGTAGTAGQKTVTAMLFKWSASETLPTADSTYDWSNNTITVGTTLTSAGWSTSSSGTGTTGQRLYALTKTLSVDSTYTGTTTINWDTADAAGPAGFLNTVGYRQDGSIGPQGDSARIAYKVTSSSTAPTLDSYTTTSPALPQTGGSSWVYPSPGTALTDGQYMYQVDGVLSGTTITWGNPYLSNLKVGSLQAISANLGAVSISTTGSLSTSGKTYGGSTTGIFIGYDSTNYKFDVTKSSTEYIRYDGSTLALSGGTITGSTISTASSGKRIVLNEGGTANDIRGYNASGTRTLFLDMDNADMQLVGGTGGNASLRIDNNSTSALLDTVWITSDNPNRCALRADGVIATGGKGVSSASMKATNYSGGHALLIDGTSLFTGTILSSVAAGTMPLDVTSTTLCTNLNADLLDNQHGSYYQNADNLNAGTVPAARLSNTNLMSVLGTSVVKDQGGYDIKLNWDGTYNTIAVGATSFAEHWPIGIGRALKVTNQTIGTGTRLANSDLGGAFGNKPGTSNSTNTWWTITINGSTYYIPVWT